MSPALAGGFFTTELCGKLFIAGLGLVKSNQKFSGSPALLGCYDPGNGSLSFLLPISRIAVLQSLISVHPKGDQSWVFIGKTDAEAETPICWPPDTKSWVIGKDPDAGKDWGQKEKGTTEDEMVGWHHWLNGHGFEWTPGVGWTQWTWVWVDSARPGMLQFIGSQRVGHNWATELNWIIDLIELYIWSIILRLSHPFGKARNNNLVKIGRI